MQCDLHVTCNRLTYICSLSCTFPAAGTADEVVEESVADNDMIMIRGPRNTRAVTGAFGSCWAMLPLNWGWLGERQLQVQLGAGRAGACRSGWIGLSLALLAAACQPPVALCLLSCLAC